MNCMFSCISTLIIAPPGRLRDGLRVLLQASGFNPAIQQADSGATALAVIAQCRPQVILLDVGLTDDYPWSTLQQLKAEWPHIRYCVLVHTRDQTNQAWAAGADAVLPVGFSAETLFAILGELISKSADAPATG